MRQMANLAKCPLGVSDTEITSQKLLSVNWYVSFRINTCASCQNRTRVLECQDIRPSHRVRFWQDISPFMSCVFKTSRFFSK